MNKFLDYSNNLVSIQKSTYNNLNIESLITPLGGFKKLINKGERVLLKTNLLNATKPEKCVITNPAVISAVAKSVLKVGGIPYIGDSPSGLFTKRRLKRVYKKSGLIKLSKQIGIELNYDTSSKKIVFSEGKKLQKISICNFVLKADKIISLPKIKTHSFMIMTLATKIMFGAVPGLMKARYHSIFLKKKDFANMLIDVLLLTKPDLVIMDGIIGMQGEGPSDGNPIKIGVILASENSIAIDIAVCKMLDIEPLGIPTLKNAKLRNLWPHKIEYPLLSPKDVRYKGFQLPSSAGSLITGKKTNDPYPHPNIKCIGCGQCAEVCYRKAIKIINKKAKIDYSKCIRCYCCHEICTYNAIDLKTMI